MKFPLENPELEVLDDAVIESSKLEALEQKFFFNNGRFPTYRELEFEVKLRQKYKNIDEILKQLIEEITGIKGQWTIDNLSEKMFEFITMYGIAKFLPLLPQPLQCRFVDVELKRPTEFGECLEAQGPCPFVTCKYHNLAEVQGLNEDDIINATTETCALRQVEKNGESFLQEIAGLLFVTRARIRQIEVRAIEKLTQSSKQFDIIEYLENLGERNAFTYPGQT